MIVRILIFYLFCCQSKFVFAALHPFEPINEQFNKENFSMISECKNIGVCEPRFEKSLNKSEDSVIILAGTTNLVPIGTTEVKDTSNLTQSKSSSSNCRGLEDADLLTQTQLMNRLTAPCRYDRFERPSVQLDDGTRSIVNVHARIFIYVMQSLDSNDLQLKMHGLLQLRYEDPRLAFEKYAPSRYQPILGESKLRDLIWVPHLFLANEHDSTILGTDEKDILTSISANGTIVISSRIKATLYCWMDLQKFPFDEQQCSTVLESWMFNTSELVLHWENHIPIAFDPKLHLTEYALINAWSNETIVIADERDMRHGAFAGNYSSLKFTVYLVRESGYYIMDYFLPSIMIVAISWVTFWLQADQTAARIIVGTSTLLSFITLASSQDRNLPKVCYIKFSEIWFLVCTLFIFSSLVELAFVNAIWRRTNNVELKKVKGKYILKSTLVMKNAERKPGALSKLNSGNVSSIASSSHSLDLNITDEFGNVEHYGKEEPHQTWATMTPQEVSLWIDTKARLVFPLAFLIFNLFFWVFAYCF